MPVGRYKHVSSRFQQWHILPPDCKSWIERRDQELPADAAPTASNALAAAASASATASVSATGRLGDLPVNVTQERLYQSRLFDLARERHKMIQESDFVRNQFIDHQVRKARSKSLGRLLQGLDIEQYRNKSASGVEKLHQRSAHAKLMILANRLLGLSIDEVSKFSEAELRQRLNISASGTQDETVPELITAPPPTAPLPPLHENQQQPQRPSTSRTQVLNPTGWMDQSLPSSSRPGSRRPGSTGRNAFAPAFAAGLPGVAGTPDRYHNRRQSSSYRARVSIAAGATGQSSPDRRPRTASARRRVQSDPRCVQLINTLTPRYKPVGKPQDVSAIIRANPSLFQPAERSSDQDEAQQQLQQSMQHLQQRQKAAKGRRTRREALEMLDNIVRTRYYEAGNLASLG